MNAIIQWLIKLVGGWLPIGTKPFPEWMGKVLWAIGIFALCTFFVNKLFPEKHTTTVQSGGQMVINQAEPRDMMGFGCNFMRAYLKAGVKTK